MARPRPLARPLRPAAELRMVSGRVVRAGRLHGRAAMASGCGVPGACTLWARLQICQRSFVLAGESGRPVSVCMSSGQTTGNVTTWRRVVKEARRCATMSTARGNTFECHRVFRTHNFRPQLLCRGARPPAHRRERHARHSHRPKRASELGLSSNGHSRVLGHEARQVDTGTRDAHKRTANLRRTGGH